MHNEYLSAEFTKTAIVPNINFKTWSFSDKNNYRPIALVKKIFKLFVLVIIQIKLQTHDHQLRLQRQPLTDMHV